MVVELITVPVTASDPTVPFRKGVPAVATNSTTTAVPGVLRKPTPARTRTVGISESTVSGITLVSGVGSKVAIGPADDPLDVSGSVTFTMAGVDEATPPIGLTHVTIVADTIVPATVILDAVPLTNGVPENAVKVTVAAPATGPKPAP